MYKLLNGPIGEPNFVITKIENGWQHSIPKDPANTDYQLFKSEINQDQAELQNADGETMSPEEAKAFVKELP